MKIRSLTTPLLACALASTALGGETQTLIDLSGTTSDGLRGSGQETVITVQIEATGQTVVGFGWLLTFEAFHPSWGDEARIEIESPLGTTFLFRGGDVGWDEEPGVYVDSGDIPDFNGEPMTGPWTFTFYESFEDPQVTPDGVYGVGQFVIKGGVPAPGALALLMIAGLIRRRSRSLA